MKKTKVLKALSFLLCVVLVAAIALFTSACNGKTEPPSTPDTSAPSQSAGDEANVVGQGATQFTLEITFKDGSEKSYTVKTDKKTVGEALTEVGLISGEVGAYGLMVETVDGETVTYENDQKYWAFYIDGNYAMSGVDTTEIKEGEVYALKVE